MFRPVTISIAMLTMAFCLAGPIAAFAADNTATGDVAGVSADLTDSNTFTINAQQLALIKRAFLADGTPITSGDTLPRGTAIHFLIYVNNKTDLTVSDVNVVDPLNGFTYTPIASGGTLKVNNATAECALDACTAAEETTIYNDVAATANLAEDAEDGSLVAGYDGAAAPPEITAGSTAGNAQLDAAPNAVWAMLFEVTLD